ncbi:ribbon-helix-helix protein, CopG family [[Clostridium] innocuum]|uniref:ribbon-helix-helix protein, CopG family n=1 Tax=Clostridium innocuum TaxID=1522 RepID=UPI000D6C17A9|nr:ribbon-helix-helix protein, CopG family [[Clostridium] innocuum]PWJ19762.1 ribbon-helix-helix CopG family protein [[Clostridium] innocuum]SSA37484.1 Ribbon-helix-helix protein, copG family [[Clostridium] innocuum]
MSANKQRTTIWLSPEVFQSLDVIAERNNCKSRSELIEKAIKFYDGYTRSNENEYLPIALSSALSGIVKMSEDRIARVLFKNAVELAMMMNVLSATAEIDNETLRKLRTKCIKDVKGTLGKINFEDVYKYQNS